jgi:hypothetical protein
VTRPRPSDNKTVIPRFLGAVEGGRRLEFAAFSVKSMLP